MDKGSQQEKEESTSVSEKEEFARSPHINLEKRKREVDEESSETESSSKRLRIGQNIGTEEDIGQIKSQSVIEEDKSKKRERSCSNDGEPAEEEERDLKKQRVEAERPNPCVISNYSFHMELGAGSFGKVMLASLTKTTKHVALKIIKKKDNPYDQKRIKAEAQTLKITGECPFLCKGLAAFQSQLHAYLVMECESKTSLWDLIHSKEKLGMETVIFFSAELVVGLQFLHSRGIVHRDLKPDNILISKDGHIKIVDFGLVAEDVSKGMKLKAVVGNFKYRAPELFMRDPYDAGVDWWAFGIILCLMATGQLPFDDLSGMNYLAYLVTSTKPRYAKGLSRDARRLLNELLEKDPEKRLGTTGDIRSHPFFRSIKWAELESLKVPSPFKPEGFSPEDLKATYTGPLPFLEDPKSEVPPDDPMVLQEFSYVNSSW
eukprot:XP_012815624.1 PREDICTED: protein kinase C delta type-like [Xenopus tropicalis]